MKYITSKTKSGYEIITCIPETKQEIEKQNQYKEFIDNYHCKGHEKDHGSYYVPDNIDPICAKHHYKCRKCNKITQIG